MHVATNYLIARLKWQILIAVLRLAIYAAKKVARERTIMYT